jgi:hypothetical protein
MTRDDLIDCIRLMPVALIVLVGLWAFCALTFAVLGEPVR